VPTDTARASTPAVSFALRLIAWSLAIFGLLRLPVVGTNVLLPVTRLQAAAGAALLGPSSLPIEVTLACSGADALALCFAAIAAYPARWRMRAAGFAGGAAVILILNTIRIGTLGRAAASPAWFDRLHVYVWPAVLTVAIAGFVMTWMSAVNRQRRHDRAEAHATLEAATTGPNYDVLTRRFALVATAFLFLFTIASPLYLASPRILAIAAMCARAAAFLLRGVGVDATTSAGVLGTPAGAFLVTQECIATPLIPVYLAAVLVYSRTWWTTSVGIAAGLPLFVAIGIARLLVVAVPGLASSPLFFIHAFSQLLVAAAMVCGAACWRHGVRPAAIVRALAALALAIALVRLLGGPYTQAVFWLAGAADTGTDRQGALMFLPAFQFGLFVALWIVAFVPSGWTRFVSGASLLAAAQVAIAAGVPLLAVHLGIVPSVPDVRAWALLGPALIIGTVVNVASSRR
jgi:exosortase/archaeosortase family protein